MCIIPSRDEPISSNLTIWFLSAIMRFTARSSTQPRHMSGLYLHLSHFIENYRTQDYDLEYCFQKAAKKESSVLRIPTRQKSICFRQSKDWKNPFPLMAMPTNSTGKFFFRIYDSSQSRGARKTAFLFGYRRLQRKNSGHSALYQCQFVRPSFN